MTIHPSFLIPHPSRHRSGFTFAEVLFAVILLGIGFIMLAGMFPVAIQQTQTSISETAAAQLAQSAARLIQQNATNLLLPPTTVTGASGSFFVRMRNLGTNTLDDDLWERIKFDAVSDTDPRFAWTAVYRRDAGESVAQLVIFVVQSRAYDIYTQDDTYGAPHANFNPRWPATFEPRLVNVSVCFGGNNPDRVWFYDKNVASDSIYANEFNGLNFITEGSFFVIASENNNISRGSVYRTGRQILPGETFADGTNAYNNPLNPTNVSGDVLCFELVPGSDMTTAEDNVPWRSGDPAGQAYVIGKGWNERPTPKSGYQPFLHGDSTQWNPTNPPDPLVGRHQDVAVYTTFITIN